MPKNMMFAVPPPCGMMTPFFIGRMGFDDTISILLSVPSHLATGNRDRAFMDFLAENLE
ncbi:MAG: hypothetical protein SWC96_01525 [Thermodesulfobacteriota bacterium]|nr:hypothetical protein [Thermodesulfobacteriota bacterium]